MNLEQLKNKKVAILGLGMEGVALANFLSNKVKNISLLDEKSRDELGDRVKEENDIKLENILSNNNFEFMLGKSYLNGLDKFDVIFRSPGIPYLLPEIQQAKKKGVEISSQIKLFFDLCPCPIIGVTGTKGKGTTATLIFEMLKKPQTSNLKPQIYNLKTEELENERTKKQYNNLTIQQFNNIYLAGNIGEPAINLINKISKDDLVILELSSFQLQDLEKSPHIAVVLNILVDHLDYHKDEAEYKESKVSIVKYQNKNDFAVINQDYLISFEYASQTNAHVCYFSAKDSVDEGAYIKPSQNSKLKTQNYGKDLYEVVLRMNDKEEVICRSDEVKLIGKHNLENIAAAAIAAKIAGADIESIKKAAIEFEGLPHRLEFTAEINEVKYYNDSFATSPGPTMAAIDSFKEPINLILGGSSKGADFSDLADFVKKSNVVNVNLIGAEAEKIGKALQKSGYDGNISTPVFDINQIVKEVMSEVKSGDVVLFSPACASFDMFKNYKDRGEKFKKAVLKLK